MGFATDKRSQWSKHGEPSPFQSNLIRIRSIRVMILQRVQFPLSLQRDAIIVCRYAVPQHSVKRVTYIIIKVTLSTGRTFPDSYRKRSTNRWIWWALLRELRMSSGGISCRLFPVVWFHLWCVLSSLSCICCTPGRESIRIRFWLIMRRLSLDF